MEAVHTDSPILKTAQAQFQQKKYDLCLLTLHTLSQAGGADEANAQALAAMCKIHKHAALQEWHKVASNAHIAVMSFVRNAKTNRFHREQRATCQRIL